MKKSDFYYELPQELIAQTPLKDRSSSRLLVMDRNTGALEHKVFKNITEYFQKGDCLVINDTKVIPARLMGERKNTGAVVEFLLLRRNGELWEVLVKPGKRAKIGDTIVFGGGLLEAEIKSIDEGGKRIVKFRYDGIFEELLDKLGQMPLPPYIKTVLEDKDRYQTVYAKNSGSAAAPTAGLHFTPELLEDIENMGVKTAKITLHVGLGTFRPVKTEEITDHIMHSEHYEINQDQADIINTAKQNGGRIIAVGTTATRTLESAADENGLILPKCGETSIFIYPGYKFKAIDALITNFHLPESTLIMLVSAFAGRENVLAAYKEAVEKQYRFFSFGDAMFIK